jgi:hypothetical protein
MGVRRTGCGGGRGEKWRRVDATSELPQVRYKVRKRAGGEIQNRTLN